VSVAGKIFLWYILPTLLDISCSFYALDRNHVELNGAFGHDKQAIILRKAITLPLALYFDHALGERHKGTRLALRISYATVNTGLAVNAIVQVK
jgi:hypothetical protein